MVCVPCFIIPLLLYIWHKFVQPYVLKFWNPWAVKDAEGNETTEFPFKCEGGVCMFGKKSNKTTIEATANPQDATEESKPIDGRLKSE